MILDLFPSVNKPVSIDEIIRLGQETSSLGLVNGKMGSALTLYRHARQMRKGEFEKAAEELLDEVCEGVDSAMPIFFFNGLCGIGWAIEYLVRNKYVEADTDEILEYIDQKVMWHIDVYSLIDISLNTGVVGLGYYLLSRIRASFNGKDTYTTAKLKEYLIYLIDWTDVLYESADTKGKEDLYYFLLSLENTSFYQTKVSDMLGMYIDTPPMREHLSTINEMIL